MFSRVEESARAVITSPLERERKEAVLAQVFTGPTVILIGCVAAAAIASATGLLTGVYAAAITATVGLCAMNEIIKAIGRSVRDFFWPSAEREEFKNKISDFEKFSPFATVVLGAPLGELLCRRIIFPLSKCFFSVFEPQAAVACAIASIFTSVFEGVLDWRHGDVWDGLATFAVSRLIIFPVYFAGGLPLAIVAQGVFMLITTLADRFRYAAS